MKKTTVILTIGLLLGLTGLCAAEDPNAVVDESKILSYIVNTNRQELRFYWRDENGNNYANFENLKAELEKENKDLIFATNGGMYKKDFSPRGLYIENGIIYSPIDTAEKGYGNFYLQPNGIFFVTKEGVPAISNTAHFKNNENIKFATQSGPMLVIDGNIHPKFFKDSNNIHIRSGVGILPNGEILFALSKEKTNFYHFASYFQQKGCKNALYLDGFVSRMYLPAKKWKQMDGHFGVIIGVTRK